MKRLMLVNVGTGYKEDQDPTKPLFKTIKNSNPDHIALVCSEKTKCYGQKIMDAYPDKAEIIVLEDEDDAEKIYLLLISFIAGMRHKGFDNIVIDYTRGTKSMSAAAVLAGVAQKIDEFKYITGERRGGIVMDGYEKILTFYGKRITAVQDALTAESLMKECRFSSSITLLELIETETLPMTLQTRVNDLIHFAYAFDCWDKFNHIQVVSHFKKVSALDHYPDFCVLDAALKCIHEIGISMKTETITIPLIADLFCNAQRRLICGEYDNCMARLYRLCELIVQYHLTNKYGIRTSSITEQSISLLPLSEENKNQIWTFLKLNYEDKGIVKIPLAKSCWLLDQMHDDILRYTTNSELRGLLSERNKSILAHGLKPITKEACESLTDILNSSLQNLFSNFNDLKSTLTFPWHKHYD